MNKEDLKALQESMSTLQEGYRDKYLAYHENDQMYRIYGRNYEPKLDPIIKVAPAKQKVKKFIPCPEHGNPMVRRKGDDNHLYCTVGGCTKVLKRKIPLEPSETGKSFGGPIKDIVPEPLKYVEPVPESEQKIDSEEEAYVATKAPIRLHRMHDRTWLLQKRSDGTESRIDITDFNVFIEYSSQEVSTFAGPHKIYINSAKVTLDSIPIE